ncbi:MAG: von Willebrand factor type A domain-containing protein [Mucilaginibacter polytrichastri]|nr:von Willebrand factor type A domain-containing protein [Mucilaginibacter polytrichastri]
MKILLFALLIFLPGMPQQKTDSEKGSTITGTVYDADGKTPLAQVWVQVVGTRIGTTTDSSGHFSVTARDQADKLRFSLVGYVTQILSADAKKAMHVILQIQETSLNEVVVLGESQSSTLLQGRVAGIQVTNAARGKRGMKFAPPVPKYDRESFNTESYSAIQENGFKQVKKDPLSTFSSDVDVASYANIRRYINQGQLPPKDAVRVEEMINYFPYDLPQPKNADPVSVTTELATAPWNPQHRLLRIALKAKNLTPEKMPPSNLVFLIDVSGSMQGENRLGLVKSSMKLLADQLRPVDKVSIVVYAGAAGLVLKPTSDKAAIKAALNELEAGGSTAGGAGIKLAYQTAREHFVRNGNNRVILATDGDFNTGSSSDAEMQRLIEKERESGIFLSVLGYGMGNYKDSKMETLADKGNGNYAYIDDLDEAKKVLISEFGSTMYTVAKDVKLQVEFNPQHVQAYRLVGYENRLLNKEDFNDDTKDAGEMGSGHTVTALYELIPAGVKSRFAGHADPLKYQKEFSEVKNALPEWATVKIRYKQPAGKESRLMSTVVNGNAQSFENAGHDFRFAAAVAEWGMLLRQSEFRQKSSTAQVLSLAKSALGDDRGGYREAFIKLVERAKNIDRNPEMALNP